MDAVTPRACLAEQAIRKAQEGKDFPEIERPRILRRDRFIERRIDPDRFPHAGQ